ncbi:MAG: molybdate ABC transporter permease subunit [Acidobacteria bacterium]|nr:molybdate ABC transporter permease subunit [Acidobacteriota bacterium]NIM62223.1 molybdate ABC transporter permease subunit [Acidobacteriota bacterium]NIO59005.1 molybdate ABC transporter permease subunit [Acidobacteriota bacterium]NIQ30051.1 molybdate ABC transporter permease subunit [Acidobacteriota bacterium]NIQ84817.1 molybdate ABC transporter permease subunit [Acidobacteriota bacterium]
MAWPALKLSLSVALVATVFVVLSGTAFGWLLARGRFRGREFLDSVLMLPLVLPPTVTGYYLIVLLGRRGLLGAPLHDLTGWSIPFSWSACVIAAVVVAHPLMVRAARGAFEAIDARQLLAAASLGHGSGSIFLRIAVPLARRGLAAGAVLSFARAIGEFGATLLLAGNIAGRTQTLPLAIYEALQMGDDRAALVLSLVLTAVSLAAMAGIFRLGRKR